ncbi:MAG TPA: hypothetical protein VFC23_22025 [Thermoanaerobaculia bacterium]|nr:hypothetical protein [Thermoanaerobaculia bacterium]
MFADLIQDQATSRLQEAGDTVPTVTFLEMLGEAARIVRKHYPGARFLEADVDYELFGSGWRFVFDVPATSHKETHSTVILYNVMGQFQMPLQLVEAPWSGDQPIPLPLPVGLEEAEELSQQAGKNGAISSVSLRWVLFPGIEEPHYILTIPDRDVQVFVGAYSRQVRTTSLTI